MQNAPITERRIADGESGGLRETRLGQIGMPDSMRSEKGGFAMCAVDVLASMPRAGLGCEGFGIGAKKKLRDRSWG